MIHAVDIKKRLTDKDKQVNQKQAIDPEPVSRHYSNMNQDKHFYKNLISFQEFSQLSDNSKFVRIPDSWNILITDVKGSTQAVREGRYKDVNLVGAASITCVLNNANESEVPFVFGGDGATLLVPDDLLSAITDELKSLQVFAQKNFKLELRVGYISMSKLRAMGADLQVAKYELSPGNYTAQFKGGALVIAEEMIKKGCPSGATLIHASGQERVPQLEGLSCRLTPLENRRGTILTLLVKPLGENSDEILKSVLTHLKITLDGNFLSARPVSLGRLFWRWSPAALRFEVRTQGQRQSRSVLGAWLQTSIRTLISMLSLKLNIPLGSFKPRKYKSEIVSNSDFKKFDETLRMVIDCTLAQASTIESFLQILKEEKKIVFGVHKSQKALMTCMVKSASANKHIHFIDGADGGYTLAAVQMKAAEK